MSDRQGNTIRRAVQNVRSEFKEFIDENVDEGEDDYDFASSSQGIRSELNRARRNVNFYGRGNYENVDGNLDSIKLIIHNFQGKNDLDAYLEWEKSEIDSH